MKILLTTLNSKYVHMNLALRYLYEAAARRGFRTELFEFTVNNDDGYIDTELIRGAYDVICFSCYVWNVRRILTLAKTIKAARPETQIVLGGPEVSFDAERLLAEHGSVDFILTGEGELSFPLLLEQLEKKEDGHFDSVPGLCWRKRGAVIAANPEGALPGFEAIPFPYESLPCPRDKVIYYETVRGCPFRCAYCLSALERGLRVMPMERVKRELDFFLAQRVMQVKFVDRTFNYDVRRCAEIIQYILDHDNGVTNFHLEICGDLIDDATVALLGRARNGLFQLEIGVQTTNAKTLAAIHRSCDLRMLSYQVGRIRRFGTVHLHLDLIAGLPAEDFLSFRNSFNDIYALMPDALQLGFLKLLPGTPLRKAAAEYGYVFREYAPYEVIASSVLSADGLARLKMIENVFELYYNRGGFSETLREACGGYETPFDFYEELASFYYLKGYQHRPHRKEDLYRILRAFFLWKYKKEPERGQTLCDWLRRDLHAAMNPEAVKKFEKKGWDLP